MPEVSAIRTRAAYTKKAVYGELADMVRAFFRESVGAMWDALAGALVLGYAFAKKGYDRLLPNRNRFEGIGSAVVARNRAVIPRKHQNGYVDRCHLSLIIARS
jgi:hypothetical protein